MRKNKLAIFGGEPIRKEPFVWKSSIGEEEKKAVIEVLESGRLSVFRGGNKVRKFERKFSDYCNSNYGIATTSGTTALHTAVSSLGIGPEDEVIVPSLTFVSTASIILQQGARPVFADIDKESYCMSAEDLESKITKKTKAIIPVHIFGHPAEMNKILSIARKHSLYIIEDAAQAHGAEYKGKKVGSFGDCGCFSFFQTKNMTCGEGGMVLSNDLGLYQELRLRREHGSPENQKTWYVYDILGFNYNMTELQAAIGIVQLEKLDYFNKRRRENAKFYFKKLKKTSLVLPQIKKDIYHVFHNFPVLLPKEISEVRDNFILAVKAEGVPIDVCYPSPLYKSKIFNELNGGVFCPNTEDISSRIITLFTDPCLTKKDLKDISDAVMKVSEYYIR